MTEEVLKKAIEVKREIDVLRKRKQELEEAKNFCHGNTSEVNKRFFEIKISEDGCYRKSVAVTSESAWIALINDIKDIDEKLMRLQCKLLELH